MKKYFTYVCLLALALFAFATHAEAGKFKFKLNTAVGVKIDLTKIFQGSMDGVEIEGLTNKEDGTPASGLVFTDNEAMKNLYVDSAHEAGKAEIVVNDPKNVIEGITFSVESGLKVDDLLTLDFEEKMEGLKTLVFMKMEPASPITVGKAAEMTPNLTLLDMGGTKNMKVSDFFLDASAYKGSKHMKYISWPTSFETTDYELVGKLVRENKESLDSLNFSLAETEIGDPNAQTGAQAVRKLIEYIPHYAKETLTLILKNSWESTGIIAELKKVTLKSKDVIGVGDPKVFVTEYKFKYTLDNGAEVKIEPNTVNLSNDDIAKITASGVDKALLYMTADSTYYSLNEGKNHNGETSYADAYGAKVIAPYDKLVEIVYDSGATKWYVAYTNTVGVPNDQLNDNQVVETKIQGLKSMVEFVYTVDGTSFTAFSPDSLKFVSVKDIDNSAPKTNPIMGDDENYRYGRTMIGFVAEKAPKMDGYRFDGFFYNKDVNKVFPGPDFALVKENSTDPTTTPNEFTVGLKYQAVHKVHVMYPKLTSEETAYAEAFTFEVDHNGNIDPNFVPSDEEMNKKFKGFEFRGWSLFENVADINPTSKKYKQAELSGITVDKDYYLVAVYWKLYKLTFMGYNSDDQMVEAKVMDNVSYGYILKESDFPTPAERKGYTFKGWANSDTPASPSPVSSWAGTSIMRDITFIPVYEINKYDVKFTYRQEDGTEVSKSYEVEHGKKVAQTDLTDVTGEASKFANHRFEAWQLNGEDMNPAEYVVTAATEFNARYTYKPLYAFYVGDQILDGSGRKVIDDKVINAPANPADDGDKEFEGWTLNGEIVNFPYTIPDANFAPGTKPNIPEQDLKFIAKYTVPFQVDFNMHGVMNPSGAWKKTAKKIKKGYELPTPQNVPKAYKFLGWSVDELNVDKLYKPGEIFTDYNADFTLHAVFHHNYNAQLDPMAIEDFCARVGSSAYPETPEKYVENYKDIVNATVTDIVDLSQVSSVVKKVEFSTKPSTEKVGDKKITVQLTYNDGTTDQVSLIMHVVDAQSLKNIIDEANHELKNPTYTDVTALEAAIAKAQQVYDNDNACTSELEAAEKQLAAALDALTVAYKPLPEDQIEKADRVYLEYGINIQGAATYNATYGGLEVANYKVFKKGYTFVMNVTPVAGYSLQNWTIFENGKPVSTFKTFAQTLRYHFAKAGKYKVVANFTKGEYSFTYGIRNEAGKGAEFVAMYDGSVIKSGTKLPAGAKVRLIVTLQDQARIVKWFVNDAVASISPEIRDNEFTVNADTKVEVELANVTSAEAVSASVKVGPNPFTNFFVIRGAQDFATYYVLNATGNRVAEGMVAGMNEVRVNAQSFAPGFYVVVLKKADGTVQAVKMIKR